MTRKTIDCRAIPDDVGCTLTLSGELDELLTTAAEHAVAVHGHSDAPELRELLSSRLTDEPAASGPGAFVQVAGQADEASTELPRRSAWDEPGPVVERREGLGRV
jgi:Protein of unknown function (DUF1059)